MKYYSLNKQSPVVDFREATILGQAPDKGLYFPASIAKLPSGLVQEIESYEDEEIAYRLIEPYVGGTIEPENLRRMTIRKRTRL